MNPDDYKYILGPLMAPFFWFVVLGLALWVTRRLFPKAEWWLFSPVSTVWRSFRRRSPTTRRP